MKFTLPFRRIANPQLNRVGLQIRHNAEKGKNCCKIAKKSRPDFRVQPRLYLYQSSCPLGITS